MPKRICPECSGSKMHEENGEIACLGCGLVLKDRDILSQRLADNFDPPPSKDLKRPIRDIQHWVDDQRKLAKQLGLNNVGNYLRHFCKICGKPSPKHSKVDYCADHKKEYQRAQARDRKRRQREKEKAVTR